jgi:hypothetical protein
MEQENSLQAVKIILIDFIGRTHSSAWFADSRTRVKSRRNILSIKDTALSHTITTLLGFEVRLLNINYWTTAVDDADCEV